MLTPLAGLPPRQPYSGRRWFAVGHSALPGGHAAGTEAARAAVAGRDAKLLLVFCARIRGMRGFHNQTLVVLAVG